MYFLICVKTQKMCIRGTEGCLLLNMFCNQRQEHALSPIHTLEHYTKRRTCNFFRFLSSFDVLVDHMM